MNIVAVIQARMGSSRLPNKVLMDLGGTLVLDRVLNRLGRSRLIDHLVVATTSKSQDDIIAEHCKARRTLVFRGSEEDVLDRYYQAALESRADAVVRITSDCPLIDPDVSDATIQVFLDQRADYASNVLERSYPRGLDTEVMTLDTLARAWREAKESYQREHVTPYIYENPGVFRLFGIKHTMNCSHHRWTLDTVEDLGFLRSLYGKLGNDDGFSWRDALDVVEQQPELADMNRHVIQKAVREL
jgi:spore coat polysaccharide biosynthesis protein SpsF